MELYFILFVFNILRIIYGAPSNQPGKRDKIGDESFQVIELEITSKIVLRFADVHFKSTIMNMEDDNNEVEFEVTIPKSAFINAFWLTTFNNTIRAVVKEKQEAFDIYNNAKTENLTAGQVSQRTILTDDVDVDHFTIKVNVAGRSTVQFNLQYQDLLERFISKYRQMIYVDTKGTIPKLTVTCELHEKEKFTDIHYSTPYAPDTHSKDVVESITEDGFFSKKMSWSPPEAAQQRVNFSAVLKPFIIEYQLEPSDDGGFVFYNEKGEFALLFSTTCIESNIMPKKIVFVIDISGSMKGTPIHLVGVAMDSILLQLRETDYFNIILFSRSVEIRNQLFLEASPLNVNLARDYLKRSLNASGDTNINDALLGAVALFNSASDQAIDDSYANSIVFLTDGEPTRGIINRDAIRNNVKNINYYNSKVCCKVSINTVAFGIKAERNFLRVLATENGGSSTVIKERLVKESSEYILESFQSVQNPSLKELRFSFIAGAEEVPVENITQADFLQYDCGSEIVISGQTIPGFPVVSNIVAQTGSNKKIFNNIPSFQTSHINSNALSRLVNYKKIKDFLKVAETSTDESTQSEASEAALELALKHEFVTPLTSLVVVDYTKRPIQPMDGKHANKALVRNVTDQRHPFYEGSGFNTTILPNHANPLDRTTNYSNVLYMMILYWFN